MAITELAPNTILIYTDGDRSIENSRTAGVAAKPGMLAELYSSGGVNCWRPNASAVNVPTLAVFLEDRMNNKGINDNYAIGDLAAVAFLEAGDKFYGILLSGETAANGAIVQSDGTGKLKAATAATAAADVGRFQCLDNVGTVGADTRIRVQVIA